MKTRDIKSWKILLSETSKRSILRNFSSDAYSEREKENKVEGDLNNYLDKSPLKHYKDYSQWITSPYPEGTLVRHVKETEARKINPSFTSIVMFPGQGSQFVGMGKMLLHFPAVRDMFEVASEILKYNLKKLCLNGPDAKLHKTIYCQPATVVCSLAALEKLKSENMQVFENCTSTCGFSLGEISALVFAGSLTFEDGIRITKIRAEAMQACSKAVKSGMMTILYGPDSDIKSAIKDAKLHCIKNGLSDPVCEIANFISAEITVLAGHDEALKYISESKAQYKIRKTSKLLVSGAFHTKLMMDAVEPLKAAVSKIRVEQPHITVLSNISGKPYRNTYSIRENISKQICSPIKWEQVINQLYERPKGEEFPNTYVCGPGFSLKVILEKINSKAAKKCYVVF